MAAGFCQTLIRKFSLLASGCMHGGRKEERRDAHIKIGSRYHSTRDTLNRIDCDYRSLSLSLSISLFILSPQLLMCATQCKGSKRLWLAAAVSLRHIQPADRPTRHRNNCSHQKFMTGRRRSLARTKLSGAAAAACVELNRQGTRQVTGRADWTAFFVRGGNSA